MKGVAIHWDTEDDTIYIGVAARADGWGWVGFGIAESGGMQGADPVIFRALDNSLIAAHILDEGLPVVDDCQDWKLNYSQTCGGFDQPSLPSPLGPMKGVAIHWGTDDDKIYIGVAARADGWVGFGIAEGGGMQGADPVIFEPWIIVLLTHTFSTNDCRLLMIVKTGN
jgi:hypothetical protein